jgi:hypothetical protein
MLIMSCSTVDGTARYYSATFPDGTWFLGDRQGCALALPLGPSDTGLPEVLRDPHLRSNLEVVVPAGFSKNLKGEIGRMAKVREVREPQEIFRMCGPPDLWVVRCRSKRLSSEERRTWRF